MAIRDVTREQFNLWKHDPSTKLFLKFVADKRVYLLDYMMDAWIRDPKGFAENQASVRGQIVELGEMEDLQFEVIAEFYKEEENSGTQSQGTERP